MSPKSLDFGPGPVVKIDQGRMTVFQVEVQGSDPSQARLTQGPRIRAERLVDYAASTRRTPCPWGVLNGSMIAG